LGNVYEGGVDMPQLLAAVDGTLPLNGPPLVPRRKFSREKGHQSVEKSIVEMVAEEW